jgi:rare lipoprotein A (peptidoglycan hydrolase)
MISSKLLAYGCLLTALCLGLLGCYSKPQPAPSQDGAPRIIPAHLDRIPNAVPKVEPLSRYGNRFKNSNTYVALNRKYAVMPTSRGYRAKGLASWYGTKFQGRKTSSGEPYNMFSMTAAHRTLPLPSYVKVTNLDNGKSVVVKVNDRGPFHNNRLLDLSYVAAHKLGILGRGTGNVEVQSIDPRDHHGKVQDHPSIEKHPNTITPFVPSHHKRPVMLAKADPSETLFPDAAEAPDTRKTVNNLKPTTSKKLAAGSLPTPATTTPAASFDDNARSHAKVHQNNLTKTPAQAPQSVMIKSTLATITASQNTIAKANTPLKPYRYLQLGAFNAKINALALAKEVEKVSKISAQISETFQKNGSIFKVRIGPLNTQEAFKLRQKLTQAKLPTPVVIHE